MTIFSVHSVQLARTGSLHGPRSRSALEFRESLLDHKFGSTLGVSQSGRLAQDSLRTFLSLRRKGPLSGQIL